MKKLVISLILSGFSVLSANAQNLNSIELPFWVTDSEFDVVHQLYDNPLPFMMMYQMSPKPNTLCVRDFSVKWGFEYTRRALALVSEQEKPFVKAFLLFMDNYAKTDEYKSYRKAYEDAIVKERFDEAIQLTGKLSISSRNNGDTLFSEDALRGEKILIQNLNRAHADFSIQEQAKKKTPTCSTYQGD